MNRLTSTAPLAGARLARADASILSTIVVYGLAALVLHALVERLTDRIAQMGCAA